MKRLCRRNPNANNRERTENQTPRFHLAANKRTESSERAAIKQTQVDKCMACVFHARSRERWRAEPNGRNVLSLSLYSPGA